MQYHKTWIIRNKCYWHNKRENKSKYRTKNSYRVFRIILETEHKIKNIKRVLYPETSCSRCILQCNHNKRCRNQKYEYLKEHHWGKYNPNLYPRINKHDYSEYKLSESLYIKHFRLIIKEQINWTETILNKIARINILSQTPVVIKKHCTGVSEINENPYKNSIS